MINLRAPPNSTKLTLSNKIPLLSWWSEVDSGTNSNPTLAPQMKSATCPNSKDNVCNGYLFFNDFVHSGLIAQGPGLGFLLKNPFPATQVAGVETICYFNFEIPFLSFSLLFHG